MSIVKAIRAVHAGHNIILHGPGGTGKSYAIGKICESVDDIMNIVVVTPTGISSVVLNMNAETSSSKVSTDAKTINREFNIPYLTKDSDLEKIASKSHKKYKYKSKIDILIIDEISMVSKMMLELLDMLLRKLYNRNKCMGGVQIIMSGDFYQLSPVKARWCFESDVWAELNLVVCKYEKSYRNVDDATFELMKRLRKNQLTDEDKAVLEERRLAYENKEYETLEFKPTILFPTNRDADSHNLN